MTAVFLLLFLVGCQGDNVIIANSGGVTTGQVGDVFRIPPLDIKVISATSTTKYGNYTPRETEQLIDVVIQVSNTSKKDLVLNDTYFQLRWGNDGFADPLPAIADKTMAPVEYTLASGETCTFHYVFPALQQATIFKVCFSPFETEPTSDSATSLYYVEFAL